MFLNADRRLFSKRRFEPHTETRAQNYGEQFFRALNGLIDSSGRLKAGQSLELYQDKDNLGHSGKKGFKRGVMRALGRELSPTEQLVDALWRGYRKYLQTHSLDDTKDSFDAYMNETDDGLLELEISVVKSPDVESTDKPKPMVSKIHSARDVYKETTSTKHRLWWGGRKRMNKFLSAKIVIKELRESSHVPRDQCMVMPSIRKLAEEPQANEVNVQYYDKHLTPSLRERLRYSFYTKAERDVGDTIVDTSKHDDDVASDVTHIGSSFYDSGVVAYTDKEPSI